MSEVPAIKTLEGEILGPEDTIYKVEYWRHCVKQEYKATSIEECIDYLEGGRQTGSLSYRDCRVLTLNDEVVMTNEQVIKALEERDEE